jgi:hypothetical protein
MLASRIRGALKVCSVLAIAACANNSEPNTPPNTPSALDVVSGNGQVGLVGAALSLPLTVRVTSSGTAVSGVSVTFTVVSGAASVSPGTATTDASGQAKTQVTLGSSPGNITITAAVAGTNLTATFLETAGTSTVTVACQSASPTTPAVGGVLAAVSGPGICLGGGTAGADYALVAFHANTDPSAIAQITVASHGATPLSSATIAPSFAEAASENIMRARANTIASRIEARVRQSERELAPMIPAARAAYRNRSRSQAAFAAVPANPAIGTIVTLNAQISPACSSPINVPSRVAAVSNLAIVLADTANPTGGFSDAEYASFAATFDTLISPLDIAAFGQPSDIDGNGKILILFTKEVNKLTPRGSNGVFGGFFHVRDLFPKADANGLPGCATSNFAEMYYALVPDPTGKFSDARGKIDVLNLTASTLAHEFQHLINGGRRIYVNDAEEFEETWLNEGLSHIAEELLYFRVAGLAPRQNIGPNVIGANAAAANNFNNYQGDNNGRFEEFLGKTAITSVYADNDSLETRGATWNLLRYLADHRGTADADTWSLLVNTTLTGQANLAHVFGSTYLTQIRDWTTSVFADDLPGQSDVRFSAPSWNLRAIFPRLVNGQGQPLGKYPLTVVPLGDTSPANVSIDGGAASYIRFTVPANTSASIDWSASGLPVSPLVQFTVVRSR